MKRDRSVGDRHQGTPREGCVFVVGGPGAAGEEITAAVQGLAAAVGAEAVVLPTYDAALARAGRADAVVLDLDLVEGLAIRAPAGRLLVVGSRAATAGEWAAAVDLGSEKVLRLPGDEAVLSGRLAQLVDGAGRQARIVGFVGGRGGAGASVLAAAFARCAARRGLATLLLDGDPLGGGLDLLLGAEDAPGLRWPGLTGARGLLPAGVVPHGLPRVDGVWLLSGDRAPRPGRDEPPVGLVPGSPGLEPAIPSAALASVLDAARRRVDLVVVDLPRWAAAASREAGCEVVILVVPADVNSVAAAGRIRLALDRSGADVALGLVVRGPAPGGLPEEVVAEVLDLPLIGSLRPEPGLAAALERREPPGLRVRGPLNRLCGELLDQLDQPGRFDQPGRP